MQISRGRSRIPLPGQLTYQRRKAFSMHGKKAFLSLPIMPLARAAARGEIREDNLSDGITGGLRHLGENLRSEKTCIDKTFHSIYSNHLYIRNPKVSNESRQKNTWNFR